MTWRNLAFALAFFVAIPAWAQEAVVDVVTTLTLNSSSGTCLAANSARTSLTIDNTANSVNIGYCETAWGAASACTPAIGSAGTTTMSSGVGASNYYPAGAAPRNQFCFISASSTPTITIREGH